MDVYTDEYKDAHNNDYKDTYKDVNRDARRMSIGVSMMMSIGVSRGMSIRGGYRDAYTAVYEDAYKSVYGDVYKDAYSNTSRDVYRDAYEDPLKMLVRMRIRMYNLFSQCVNAPKRKPTRVARRRPVWRPEREASTGGRPRSGTSMLFSGHTQHVCSLCDTFVVFRFRAHVRAPFRAHPCFFPGTRAATGSWHSYGHTLRALVQPPVPGTRAATGTGPRTFGNS